MKYKTDILRDLRLFIVLFLHFHYSSSFFNTNVGNVLPSYNYFRAFCLFFLRTLAVKIVKDKIIVKLPRPHNTYYIH